MAINSSSSPKQQCTSRYVAALEHIILTPRQVVFVNTPSNLGKKAVTINIIRF